MFKIQIKALILAVALITSLSAGALADLVDIQKINPTIRIDLKYTTTNNFTGWAVYPASARCYLRRAVAEKLNQVQKELAQQGLGLLVWDGYRPLAVQKIFWNLVPDERYVMPPTKGSRHNRGAAVDVTLVKLADGKLLPMPTEFDDFTEKAHRNYQKLPKKVLKNRQLLETVMTKHGFVGLPTEWWHFDAQGWQEFELLDVDFATLAKN